MPGVLSVVPGITDYLVLVVDATSRGEVTVQLCQGGRRPDVRIVVHRADDCAVVVDRDTARAGRQEPAGPVVGEPAEVHHGVLAFGDGAQLRAAEAEVGDRRAASAASAASTT